MIPLRTASEPDSAMRVRDCASNVGQGIGADECKMNAQIMEYSNDLSILVFYRHKKVEKWTCSSAC